MSAVAPKPALPQWLVEWADDLQRQCVAQVKEAFENGIRQGYIVGHKDGIAAAQAAPRELGDAASKRILALEDEVFEALERAGRAEVQLQILRAAKVAP